MTTDKDSIANIASAVFDNGRRGNPRAGCDCVQCFGYCFIDGDKAQRDYAEKGATPRTYAPLDFDREGA